MAYFCMLSINFDELIASQTSIQVLINIAIGNGRKKCLAILVETKNTATIQLYIGETGARWTINFIFENI